MPRLKEVLDRGRVRYFFTGGKGGVGKTVVAAGIAYHYAANGEKTLLASLNPVHSLTSLFAQDLRGGVVKRIEGTENLYAIEVEIDDVVEKYKENIARRLKEFMKWADIPLNPQPFIEIATTNPAFQESAMFDKMMDIVLKEGEEYDRIVFDTAAVANAARLIGLSKLYGLWLARMIKSREEALSLRVQLSFRKEKVMEEIKKDPLMADLLELNEKFAKARDVLTDSDATSFLFVTLPLALPISVVKRFIDMVRAYDIPVGGVVVNQLIEKRIGEAPDATSYIRNKYMEQLHYMEMIMRDMGNLVAAYLPMYPSEVVGVEMVERVAGDLLEYEPDFLVDLRSRVSLGGPKS